MFALFSVLLTSLVALAPAPEPPAEPPPVFPTGEILEDVQSRSSPTERFVLYVPTTYDGSRPTPVIYLMDSRRRARLPAELFRPVAERLGYILISSYSTVSDESMEPNMRAIQAMWTDSHDWFHVDDRRAYLAGYSGTARAAWLLARHLAGTFAGVIAAGAGAHPAYPASKDFKVPYFATAGDADYNFYELQRLEEQLVSLELPHRIEYFRGPHVWMSQDLATEAVEWMQVRAMRDGACPPDEALIEASWQRDEMRVLKDVEHGKLLEATRLSAAMARDYVGLRDTTAVAARARHLAETAEARRQLQQRRKAAQQFGFWIDEAMRSISDAFAPGADEPVLLPRELAVELDVARMKRAVGRPDPTLADEALGRGRSVFAGLLDTPVADPAGREALRRLNAIGVQLGFYLPREAIERAEYARAAYYLNLALDMDDGSPVSWYLLAVAEARMRERRLALAALERALETGFRDLALFESERAFAGLREDPAFEAVGARLQELLRRP